MKLKPLLVTMVLFPALTLSACSSLGSADTEQITTKEANEFLDLASDDIESKGKLDFNSLILDKDDFTKEAYLELPKQEKNKTSLNDIQLEFGLYKSSDSEIFRPVVYFVYGGKDWLFMSEAIFKINNEVMTFSPEEVPFRDTLSTGVFEAMPIFLTDEQVNFLGTSESITDLDVRVITETFEEIKLNSIEYKGMKKILSAYRYHLSRVNQ